MNRDEFLAFAMELGERFRGTGTDWIVVVLPPGSLTNEAGPHSAGNMSAEAQIGVLREIAASLESNTAAEIIRKPLGPR
jgi:hypothetical protein